MALALTMTSGAAVAQKELEDDPAFLAIGPGFFDAYRQRDTAGEARIEYRDNHRFWLFKPLAGAMVTTDNAYMLFAGVRMDLFFGDRWVVTPSFAPGYWSDGDSRLKLGHHIEFRSQLEIGYRFDNRARLSVGYGHISNAHLGKNNPGVESAFAMFSIPLWE